MAIWLVEIQLMFYMTYETKGLILPLVVCRYSHQILYGQLDPCWILSDNVLHIQSHWKFFPWYIMPLVNCILSFWHRCSTIELELFTPEACGICFHDAPMVEPMPFIICVNSKVFMSHTLLVFCQIKIFNTTTSSNARSEWKVMHWRSGSRPWTLRSCPWTRCRSYH